MVPLTFLVSLPFTQTMVFLATTGVGTTVAPVKTIVALADTGASVVVPTCEAVTTQLPALIRLRVDPEMEQFSVEVVENEIVPPLEAVATSAKLLLAISTVETGENVIVCGSLVTSNETLYKSEAKKLAFSLV